MLYPVYRHPLMRALGLNLRGRWLRLAVALAILATAFVLGMLAALVFGVLMALWAGVLIDGTVLALIGLGPLIVLGCVYATDSWRRADFYQRPGTFL
jgi:hypothetical protein